MRAIQKREDVFDFDSWAALAKYDQEAFEESRQERIREVIEKSVHNGGNGRRLRGLQCRIDMERRRARTPLKACIRLSSMMWDSVVDLSETLEQCSGMVDPAKGGMFSAMVPERKYAPAKLIRFPGRKPTQR